MKSKTIKHAAASVCAASIAAELHLASQIARKLSLSAKNARVAVLRAGSQAASLKVISDFFDDLANQTIVIAARINISALDISRLAVMSWRNHKFLHCVEKAQLLNPHMHSDPMIHQLLENNEHRQQLQDRYRQGMQQLVGELEEIQQFMRAANVISVTSRLEATQTGSFQATLVHMANTIQQQSDAIKTHVTRSQRLMQDIY